MALSTPKKISPKTCYCMRVIHSMPFTLSSLIYRFVKCLLSELQFKVIRDNKELYAPNALRVLFRVLTSNCISRLFWFGSSEAGIQKKRSAFLKEAKAAALQLHSPPAAEAKITMLKELTIVVVVVNYCTNDLK